MKRLQPIDISCRRIWVLFRSISVSRCSLLYFHCVYCRFLASIGLFWRQLVDLWSSSYSLCVLCSDHCHFRHFYLFHCVFHSSLKRSILFFPDTHYIYINILRRESLLTIPRNFLSAYWQGENFSKIWIYSEAMCCPRKRLWSQTFRFLFYNRVITDWDFWLATEAPRARMTSRLQGQDCVECVVVCALCLPRVACCNESGSSCSQDQYENISAHTQKGIDFLEKYGHFIRDRCAIEMDYAGKLRWVIKPNTNIYEIFTHLAEYWPVQDCLGSEKLRHPVIRLHSR